MKPFFHHIPSKGLLFGLLAPFVLASCGSYQYAGYDHDGIYSSGTTVAETYTEEDHEDSYENTLYYQQAFSQKAQEFENIAQGSAIFTDIDSYNSGAYEDGAYAEDQYSGAYGGWGSQADEISINVYNNNPYWYGGYSYYPYYSPFYHPHSYWNYGYGYGYGPYGWYGSPGWSIGFGSWGYASVGWGFGYNHWGYSPYYPYRSYYSYNLPVRNVAYMGSRRNSSNLYTRSNVRSNDARVTRSYRNTSNVRASSRSNNDYSVTRSTRATNDKSTYRTRTSGDTPAVRSNRSSRTREYTPATRTRTQNTTPQVRSSSTRSSSGGSVRSSSSSSVRSSGTSTRSSSSSRRGGN